MICRLEYQKIIKIEPEDNTCTCCGKPYTHRRTYRHGWIDDERLVKEVTLVTAHAGCRTLTDKITKLKNDLLDLEFQLFLKKEYI